EELQEQLQTCNLSQKDSASVIKAYYRLCQLPLGTLLNFGSCEYESKSNGVTVHSLTRSKCDVPPLGILYCAYKYAESVGAWQFSLSSLLGGDESNSALCPGRLFGLDRDELAGALNGLAANYPKYVGTSFTHDLEKISLSESVGSGEVLELALGLR
ncbi:MAG: phosphoadenosine phosphosulfate reductase, partial [Thermoguttaceae bacterium]|nr:phosphoadenosine phosphosulfate reductase [Thermoguttaceae bacterium]